MTDIFTASNGIEIEISQDGYLLGKGDYGSGSTYATAGPEGIGALREYFQHERDTELGRWRDENDPDMVVYRNKDYACTLSERTGGRASFLRRDFDDVHGTLANDPHARTARRYFAAHPEKKPWHGAKTGEVWLLDIEDDLNRETPAVVTGQPEFRTHLGVYFDLGSPQIVHARKIWPEESDDE